MKPRPTAVAHKASSAQRFGLSSLAMLTVFALAPHGAARAQGPLGAETVSWTLSASPADSVKPGSRVVLSLQGAVRDTWHVYGLKQLPAGPTPLRIALEPGGVAAADGAPTANAPIKVHDPSFDLETQYYNRDVTVKVPVRIAARAAAGPQQIPLTVRYQTCDGRVCQPPKSVRLSATVNVRGG